MNVYKRSLYVMIKGIVAAPFSGLVVYFFLSLFIGNDLILFGVFALVTFMVFYTSVFSSRISFTVSPDGEFCYYKKGKLEEQYDLKKCSIGYDRQTDGTYINLTIIDENGKESVIDAEPLGSSRFLKMYENMKQFVKDDEIMKATESSVMKAK